jgi:ubiquinone biosynthesis protein COQ9
MMSNINLIIDPGDDDHDNEDSVDNNFYDKRIRISSVLLRYSLSQI